MVVEIVNGLPFLNSRLTPLLIVASIVVGVGAVLTTPREEEPQISVPMVDVFSSLPGGAPEEVDRRVTEPLERRLWEMLQTAYSHH
jgi:multidrug efflux pump subunit AcrB